MRHYVGAFLVKLGGLDVLTFSGGIGENSAGVRAAVCAGLEGLGIASTRRATPRAQGEAVLSPDGARVTILLVPADEERIVARAVAQVVGAGPRPEELSHGHHHRSRRPNVVAPRNRLIGPMPKIGIRPAIDGRRKGVRESLERQTLEMAQVGGAAPRSRSCATRTACRRVRDRRPCIGGVAEAAQTAAQFEREGVGVSLTVTPCWCYGAETMDMDPLVPEGGLGLQRHRAARARCTWRPCSPRTTRRACPPSASTAATCRTAATTTIPADVEEKLLRFARAGLAVATMRGKSYLSLGGISMGIAGSIVDPDFFEDYLGMRVETVDMTEFVRRIEERIYDEEEFDAGPRLGEGALPGGPGLQRAGAASARARRRTPTGRCR